MTHLLEYAGPMNNREWYSEVIRFCRLSERCSQCPYHLLGKRGDTESVNERPCFSSSEALMALSSWLALPVEGAMNGESGGDEDHQWLRDLIKMQFDGDEDEELLDWDEHLL